MSDFTVEDYQEFYDDWVEEYEPIGFIDYSEENWEKIQKMNPRHVWTNHSTCEDDRISAGASLYRNSCCWDTFGWWICKNPWEGPDDAYLSIDASAYLPCPTCNPEGDNDEGPTDCACEGDGYITWYAD